jgi:multicomponent Na+:H+ antiporter subunit G
MVKNIIAGVFCAIGTTFFILGTTGLLRMPDIFARLHPSTKCDTLGGCSVLVGVAIYNGLSFDTLRLLLIVGFLLISSATCGHAIGRSAFLKGIPVWKKKKDQTEEEKWAGS